MNSNIDILNSWGLGFLQFAFSMLWQTTLLVSILAVLDIFLSRYSRAIVRYSLWMLVIVKLMLPPTFSLPTGLGQWLAHVPSALESENIINVRLSATDQLLIEPAMAIVVFEDSKTTPVQRAQFVPAATAPAPPAIHALSGHCWAMLAWLFGIILGTGILIRRSLIVSEWISLSVKAPDSWTQLLQTCCQQIGIRRIPKIKITLHASSPVVCGLWNSVILIPEALANQITEVQMRTVLFHELSHIKRHDIWVNYVQTLIQIIYFYNPAVWMANARIRQLREQAVDESVLFHMGDTAFQYPETLLELARFAFKHPRLALGMMGIMENQHLLANRIRHILARPFPARAKTGLLAMGVIVLIGAVVLPMAQVSNKSNRSVGKAISAKIELGDDAQLSTKWIDSNRTMQLKLVDNRSGTPMAGARVSAILLTKPGEFSSSETTSDSQGHCLISIRRKEFAKLGITVFANGYSPGAVNFSPATFTNQHKLKLLPQPTEARIVGKVLLPDGAPAADAKGVIIPQGINMGLSMPQTNNVSWKSIDPFTAYGLSLYRFGSPESGAMHPFDMWNRVRVDAEGRFAVQSAPYREGIALVHEFGYARISFDTLTSENAVVLNPWGRIEGVLRVGQSPGVRQKVMACNQENPAKDSFRYRYVTETDDQGRFAFAYVPAGRAMVARYFDAASTSPVVPLISANMLTASNVTIRAGAMSGNGTNPGQPPTPLPSISNPIFVQNDYAGSTAGNSLEVKPGKVAYVTLGGKGCTVVGKMLSSGYSGMIDWSRDILVNLLIAETGLSASPVTLSAFPTGVSISNVGRGKDIIMPGYYVDFQPDGSFRINDVRPGAYRMIVRISKTITNAENTAEVREIAFSNIPVQVPDRNGSIATLVDLGDFELEILPDSGRPLF